mgnify:CR=1 FL=1
MSELLEKAKKLHFDSIVIDGLNASIFNKELLERVKKGGITAFNATVSTIEDFKDTISNILFWKKMFLEFKNLIIPVTNVKDIEKAKELNKVGIILGFQNTSPLEGNIKFLSVFKEMGVKIIQLTYNERNLVGNGCFERVDGGLSKFGIRIIKEMNKLGILVDLSHVGPKSTMEAIEISEKPVAITHANPRTLFDYPRNKTDEQIKLLASKDGVIGVTFWPFFLSKGMNSTIEDYLDNIDYMINLVGIDYVSIASDFFLNRSREMLQKFRAGRSEEPSTVEFEWPVIYPEGIRIPEEFPNITYGLLKRGYSHEDVRKIMGKNLVRIFKEVW